MLREMVVEEGLSAFEENRDYRVLRFKRWRILLESVLKQLRRIEKTALSNFKKNMLELEQNNYGERSTDF